MRTNKSCRLAGEILGIAVKHGIISPDVISMADPDLAIEDALDIGLTALKRDLEAERLRDSFESGAVPSPEQVELGALLVEAVEACPADLRIFNAPGLAEVVGLLDGHEREVCVQRPTLPAALRALLGGGGS